MSSFRVEGLRSLGRIGRYDIVGRLAIGGMAEIYLARETGPHSATRTLVVKRVLPHIASDQSAIQMFIQEAQLCMRLRHPAICPIYEFGEAGGTAYLAMEWVEGVSLRTLLERAKSQGIQLPIPVIAYVLAAVAGGLHHAHTAVDERNKPLGIVHRDVTPENVMLGFDGQVKLLDFGVAKAESAQKKTQAGELKGKFAYMSPEQYRGDTIDRRCDIFSLGAVAFEVLTGEALFARASEFETVAAIVLDSKIPTAASVRPDLPESLDAIVTKALRRDRTERFDSADEMQIGLERFLAEGRYEVRPATLAALLKELFPKEHAAGPTLDTKVRIESTQQVQTPRPSEAPARFELEAQLDALEDEFSTTRRRKRTAVTAVLATVVIATLAIVLVYAVASRPEEGGPPREPPITNE